MTRFGAVTLVVTSANKKGPAHRSGAGPASVSGPSGPAINYWMAVPPLGEALSLPPAPSDELACQIVPVVFVKK